MKSFLFILRSSVILVGKETSSLIIAHDEKSREKVVKKVIRNLGNEKKRGFGKLL